MVGPWVMTLGGPWIRSQMLVKKPRAMPPSWSCWWWGYVTLQGLKNHTKFCRNVCWLLTYKIYYLLSFFFLIHQVGHLSSVWSSFQNHFYKIIFFIHLIDGFETCVFNSCKSITCYLFGLVLRIILIKILSKNYLLMVF